LQQQAFFNGLLNAGGLLCDFNILASALARFAIAAPAHS
jgi:hypothetical protein